MKIDTRVFHVYFYAKKEPRKSDGRYPVMGRLVFDDKRMQFSTQIYLEKEKLPFIGAKNLGKKKSKDLIELMKVADLMRMIFFEMREANLEIDLSAIVSKYKNILEDTPRWWRVYGR